MAKGELEIQYTEVPATNVVEFFVAAYKRKPDSYEWFYDPAKQKFVFRLYYHAGEAPHAD